MYILGIKYPLKLIVQINLINVVRIAQITVHLEEKDVKCLSIVENLEETHKIFRRNISTLRLSFLSA